MLDFLRDNAVPLLALGGAVVAGATAVVAMTPSKKDDEVMGKVASYWDKFVSFVKPLSLKK